MDLTYIFVQRLFGFILGLLLFYMTFKLLKALKNKEIALSMVFLHEKRIINLFGLTVISGLLTFFTGLSYVFLGNSVFIELLLDLNALVMLLFTFFLQKLMRRGEE
ncbi:MAG TPA: hypothetical protein PL168_02855 [Methanobacterium sp.]|nr:hypothetical protein [Methanobacterium sp.]HOI39646.1 hypothetical protein [Methanobacterium sp.]